MKSLRKYVFLLLLCALIALGLIWLGANNSLLFEHYYHKGELVTRYLDGPFSVELDMIDLNANKGIVVWQDKACCIMVDEVRAPRFKDEPYQVYFSCNYDVSVHGMRQITAPADIPNYKPSITVGTQEYPVSLQGHVGDLSVFGYYLPFQTPPTDTIVFNFPFLVENIWE